jgi:gamma-glutamylcyclotransferase (GGCT)/AIG2-like uncharacterized protein YtfP
MWAVFIYGSLRAGEQQSCPMNEAEAKAEAASCNQHASCGVRYEAHEVTSEPAPSSVVEA